jgi:hypothetical protein
MLVHFIMRVKLLDLIVMFTWLWALLACFLLCDLSLWLRLFSYCVCMCNVCCSFDGWNHTSWCPLFCCVISLLCGRFISDASLIGPGDVFLDMLLGIVLGTVASHHDHCFFDSARFRRSMVLTVLSCHFVHPSF